MNEFVVITQEQIDAAFAMYVANHPEPETLGRDIPVQALALAQDLGYQQLVGAERDLFLRPNDHVDPPTPEKFLDLMSKTSDYGGKMLGVTENHPALIVAYQVIYDALDAGSQTALSTQ